MRRYKTIAPILLIVPIINFAFALPVAVQETSQVRGDVVSDDAKIMLAKRGNEMEQLWNTYFERLSGKPDSSPISHPPSGSPPSDGSDEKMTKLWNTYFERLSGKPESSSAPHPPSGSAQSESDQSDHGPMNGHAPAQSPASLTAPEHGSKDLPQTGTSEIEELSPEVSNSPSFDRYVIPPKLPLAKAPSFDTYYLGSPEADAPISSVDKHQISTVPESGSSPSAASGSVQSVTNSPMGKPKSKSFLRKMVSKLKFWRRISGPGSVRDAVNLAQRELQGLVDTGVYVSAHFPGVTNVLTL